MSLPRIRWAYLLVLLPMVTEWMEDGRFPDTRRADEAMYAVKRSNRD